MTHNIIYHTAHRAALSNYFIEGDWVWLYKKCYTKVKDVSTYSHYLAYLATPQAATKSLDSAKMDVIIERPGSLLRDYPSQKMRVHSGFEHLVIVRDCDVRPLLHDIRISDEIIYFYDLFERKVEQDRTQFYSFESGNENLVCEITPNSVRILRRYLTDFMLAKHMDLVCICQSEVEFPIEKVQLPFQLHYTPKFNFVDISPDSHSKYKLCIARVMNQVQSWFNGKTILNHQSYAITQN